MKDHVYNHMTSEYMPYFKNEMDDSNNNIPNYNQYLGANISHDANQIKGYVRGAPNQNQFIKQNSRKRQV